MKSLTKQQAEQMNELTRWVFDVEGAEFAQLAMTENQARRLLMTRTDRRIGSLLRVEASGQADCARIARIARGEQCPECGCTDTESNGSTEYRCCACDHRWGTDMGMTYGYDGYPRTDGISPASRGLDSSIPTPF